ncbi:MAG: F0F1 ATP synthase subunit alpha, partial [Melioribacteraceae bacterium]|nr:F0F1 ATP synthase subunit alpha [Melioribacteraceae bacterium]
KQGQYTPIEVEKQVVSVFMGTQGFLDELPINDIKRFEAEFIEYLELKSADILKAIREEKVLSDTTVEGLKSNVNEFLTKFKVSD